MQQVLAQNMEFVIAALIGLAMIFLPAKSKQATPSLQITVFDEMALCLVLSFPERYKHWLTKILGQAAYRSPQALARLSSRKLYPALLTLPLLLVVPPAILLPAAILVFFAADLLVCQKARQRQAAIAASLPQAIDIMLLCVDAGLGLDATMQRIAADRSSLSSALNDELSKLGRDILLGMDRQSAYQDLYRRTGVEELRSFAAALNQSSKMGLSIGKILRAQSQFMRMRQSQKAQEKAGRLPIWMTFPLWFCIMPSLLLILLGPSLIPFFEKISFLH